MLKVLVARILLISCLLAYFPFERAGFASSTPVRPAVKRISSHVLDLGKPHELFLVTGMVTVIVLPEPISRVTLGNENDYKYTLTQESPGELIIKRVSNQTLPTDLIIKSGGHHYDFDLHPSRSINQDIFEITGYYGGPEFEDSFFSEAVVIDSSDSSDTPTKSKTRSTHRTGVGS